MIRTLLVVMFTLFSSGYALAQDLVPETSKTAVGIGVGTTDGISVFHEYAEGRAFNGMLSLSEATSKLSADMVFLTGEGPLRGYYGIGGAMSKRDRGPMVGAEVKNAVRVPLGLVMDVKGSPLQLGMEVAPEATVDGKEIHLENMISVRMKL